MGENMGFVSALLFGLGATLGYFLAKAVIFVFIVALVLIFVYFLS